MKHRLTKIVLFSIMALAVIGLGAALLYPKSPWSINRHSDSQAGTASDIQSKPVGEVDYSKPTEEQQNAASSSAPQTQVDATQQNSIPTTISYAGGNPLQIRVLISEILSSGSCTLSLKKNGVSQLTQTVDLFPTASSTTCKGFTVDVSSLEKGTYSLDVTVSSGDRQGSAQKEITI